MVNKAENIFFTFGDTVMIIYSNLIIEPKLFKQIFTMAVSKCKFINLLISLFTRETVRSIALDKVFVKQSFHNLIYKHGFRGASFQEEGYSKS